MEPQPLPELVDQIGLTYDANDPKGALAKEVADLRAKAAQGTDFVAALADLKASMTPSPEAEALQKELDDLRLQNDRALAEHKMIPTGSENQKDLTVDDLLAPEWRQKQVGPVGIACDLLRLESFITEKGLAKSRLMERKAFQKALDVATDGSGADWVPGVEFSPQFVADVETAIKLPAAFTRRPMTSRQQRFPADGAWPTAYYVAENTDITAYNTNIMESAPTTHDVMLTAQKLAVRTVESMEFEADALPICLAIVRNKLTGGLARAIEDAILNGDTATSHNDTDVTAAIDRRKAFLGLRAKTLNDTGANEDISILSADALTAMMGNMGEYGADFSNLIWVVGSAGLAQLRVLRDSKDNAVVLTIDKYGPAASVISGEVAKLFGAPVIYTPFMREDLCASGYYDGTTTTKTAILAVYRPAWVLGDLQQITLESQRHIGAQVVQLVATWRGDFQHALGTNLTTAMGYNLAV